MTNQDSIAVAASLMQLSPEARGLVDGLAKLVDSPITREPFMLGTVGAGTVVAAGAVGVVLPTQDLMFARENPMELKRVRFSLDAAHTYRDVSISIQDNTFAHYWMNNAIMLDTLIDPESNSWVLEYPWILKPQGGGLQIMVNNLDALAPLTISVALIGSLLIPQARQ